MKKPFGILIVIEGTDGSGKATQVRLLAERLLREYPDLVRQLSFPRYDKWSGKIIRAFLNGKFGNPLQIHPKRASLLYAFDRWLVKGLIKRWLKSGCIVLLDRYVPSNMGHQGSKFHDLAEKRAFIAWEDSLEYGRLGLPRPDKTLILRVPAEVAQRRAQKRDKDNNAADDVHQNNLEHLKNAELTYLEIAKLPNHVLVECAPDGRELTPEEIHELIWTQVTQMIA